MAHLSANELRTHIFDTIVDTLTEMADPTPIEYEEVRYDMQQVAQRILDKLNVSVKQGSSDNEMVVTLTLDDR